MPDVCEIEGRSIPEPDGVGGTKIGFMAAFVCFILFIEIIFVMPTIFIMINCVVKQFV